MKDYIRLIETARKDAAKNTNTPASVYLGKWSRPLKVVFRNYDNRLETCNVFYIDKVGGVDYDFSAAWFYSNDFTSAEIFDIARKAGETL